LFSLASGEEHLPSLTVSANHPPSLWTLAFGHHEDRTPTHGYEPTRETAMAAFAKGWWREQF